MKCILPIFITLSIIGHFSQVNAQLRRSPFLISPYRLPAKVEAENYDKGGQSITYNDLDFANQGNSYRITEGVDVEVCLEGGFNVGYIATGEWLEYTVTVTTATNYTVDIRTASTQSGGKLRLDIDGIAATTNIVIPNTSGWQNWATTSVTGVSLSIGQHIIRVFIVNGGFNINYFTISSPAALAGPGFLHAESKNIINNKGNFLIKAINLGNYMVQEGYMLNLGGQYQHVIKQKIADAVGVNNRDKFYEDYYANFITKADIDIIAQMGFNSVRLPMHYNLFTPLGQQDVYIEKGFALVDNILTWCKANNLYLILDLHAAPGGQSSGDISDYIAGQPSLWESQSNRDQTVKLWKKFAERYASEEYIGGYDIINETNWTIPNNELLKDLMINITAAIRSADKNHILFIEGNSYANDYTNLTPKWDDNMAYSFHKYWNDNTDASLDFIFSIRDEQNVPIWLGEFGENSNTWMSETVTLLNKHNIGWAIWPYKKMSSISGAGSFREPANWASLAGYINGGPQPASATVQAVLNELVENVKIQNCAFNKGYLRALFDQPGNDNTVAYAAVSLPGKLYAAQYDEGKQGFAYSDNVFQTVQFGSKGGDYTAWNTGWYSRNDGVDLEFSTIENSTIVGWTEDNEWLQYTVDVPTSGAYTLRARVAGNGGNLRVSANNSIVLNNVAVASTGGWTSWQTLSLGNVNLMAGKNTIRITFLKAGFNLNYLDFAINTGPNKLPAVSISAPSNGTMFTAPASFSLNANATDADGTIAKVEFYSGARLLGTAFTFPYTVSWSNAIAGTYTVTAKATDNLGASTVSASVIIIVTTVVVENQLPNVVLTAPANNSTMNAPANIIISADASDSDGYISRVEFYNGTLLLGTDNSAPYNYIWTGVGLGIYNITAKAIDNQGATKLSSVAVVILQSVATDVCAGIAPYSENGGYVSGSKVKNNYGRYECKSWPYSGWCNGADWAYAPGSGAYWTDAWTFIGECSNKRSFDNNTVFNSSTFNVSPNPFLSSTTLSVVVTDSDRVSLKLYDRNGQYIQTIVEDYLAAASYNFSLYLTAVPAGIYLVKYITRSESMVIRIEKLE